jgi:hypothetical protein
MPLEYFGPDANTLDVIAALRRDGAVQLMGYQLHRTLGAFQHPDGTWFQN